MNNFRVVSYHKSSTNNVIIDYSKWTSTIVEALRLLYAMTTSRENMISRVLWYHGYTNHVVARKTPQGVEINMTGMSILNAEKRKEDEIFVGIAPQMFNSAPEKRENESEIV